MVVGEGREKRSTNLLRIIDYTNNFTRYLAKSICETENLEERVAVLKRILEVMVVLQEHNNFTGVLAITGVLASASVHRLNATKEKLKQTDGNLMKALEEASTLIENNCKGYLEKLRSINPPCVPFFGKYQTNIVFLEEGNPDFLLNSDLINFSKRRKVAEIISEIQQYQNQPYCLSPYQKLKQFLEDLDPFPEMESTEVEDYLYRKSLEIEPRNSDTIKRRTFERKWPGLNLKSPGIRPKGLPGKNHPKPLPNMSRQSKDDVSPLVSPSYGSPGAVFKQSPVSTPLTPSLQTSPRESDSSSHDPIKMPVILPDVPSSTSNPNYTSLPVRPPTAPPPLPPKLPPKPRSSAGHGQCPPGVRDCSPPPPIPPRSSGSSSRPVSHSASFSHRSPLESRPPLMDPVFPQHSQPPTILPRHRQNGTLDTPPPVSSLSLSSSPLSRPPDSLPHSASWLSSTGTHAHNGHVPPLSAGPEIGKYFCHFNLISSSIIVISLQDLISPLVITCMDTRAAVTCPRSYPPDQTGQLQLRGEPVILSNSRDQGGSLVLTICFRFPLAPQLYSFCLHQHIKLAQNYFIKNSNTLTIALYY